MKKKIANFTFCLFCFFALLFIFKHNREIANVILDAIHLFFKKVFVSLFPMFILNDIFIYLRLPYYFYSLFHNLFKKVFKTSGICAYIFIMSIISGTPTSTYILKNLLDNQQISIEEAHHYLYFIYFSNPLFLTMMLSQMFSSAVVFKIIFIHYFSNFLLAFLLRNKAPRPTSMNIEIQPESFGSVLTKSIQRSMATLLIILGTIVFYMLLSFIITSILPQNPLLQTMVSGFFEITNGLNHLLSITLSLKLKEIIALTIISFGGLSIHTQVRSILEETSISYTPFLKGRIFQTLIGIFLLFIF